MTTDKDFKILVRARMRLTGETYTAARRVLQRQAPPHSRAQATSESSATVDAAPTESAAPSAAATEQRRLVERWFTAGRLTSIPSRRKVRAAVLLEVLTRFEPDRSYSEPEIRTLLEPVHEDFAYLRRELVSLRYLHRANAIYRVCPTPPARTEAERGELPAWEAEWLPDFVDPRHHA